MQQSQPTSMPMQSPTDLFAHELSDMLSAERLIAKMLAQAEGMVRNPQLLGGIQRHRQETEQHARNIEQIFRSTGLQQHPTQCKAVMGLMEELKEGQQAKPSEMVLEGLVVGGAAKTEHYEIAGYTGLIEQARAMGQTEAVRLLEQNLQQEQRMLREVEQVAQKMTQQMASMQSGQMGGRSQQMPGGTSQ